MRMLTALLVAFLSLLIPAVARAGAEAHIVASRSVGVAPLAIYFDGSGSVWYRLREESAAPTTISPTIGISPTRTLAPGA